MAKFILNDDGSFTQEKKRKKQTSKYEELKNVPFTGQSKFKTQSEDKYFKKSKGNAGQAIGYSALDALGNFTEGSLNFFEGMSDSARYAGANVLDFFGADKKAKEIRERARENDVEDIVNQWNHITAGDFSGTKSEKEIGRFKKVEDNSIFGEKSDQVIQGVGNSLTGAAVGSYLGAPITGVGKGADLARNVIGLTSFGSSAAGHATTEAYNEGANDFQAGVYGILSGAVESGSEMLFGGLGKINKSLGFGTGALDDVIVKKLTKNIGNTLFRNIATIGLKSAGEGVEEIASLIGDQLVRRMMNMDSKTLKELAEDGTLADTFVQGTLSSLISQTPSGISSTVQGRDYTTGLTRTQQQYVNEIAQQRMVEAQKRNARLNGMQKSQIEDRALTDFQRGRLADANKLEQVNLPGISTKDMDLQQSAYKYGFNPNSEAIVTAKTMLDNRGIKSRFDAEAFKGSNENSFWTKKADGTREVVFNPNASEQTILEEIAIHELTHDLMSSKNSKDIINNQNIMNYVSKLKGYKEARANVEKLYAEKTKGMTVQQKADYINEEIVADTLGKNIGSQEYIRRLIDDEPSIAKKIYDWVVNKVVNNKGVKNEKAYWNNVKNNFEKAYNMEYQGKGSKNKTKFSIQTDKNGKKYVNIDTDQSIFEGLKEKDYNKIAKMYINEYLKGETTLAENDTAIIDSNTAKKYTNPGKKQSNFKEKMRLSTELKNVLEISEKVDSSLPIKDNSKYGKWEYYKVQFKLGNETFEGLVNIGIDSNNNKHLYEVNNIKKTSGISETSPNRPTGFSEDNVPQSSDNVKSDQIKNVDNTNPTDDADIRKSQQNEEWQSFLDKNFEAKGTKTRLSDIKLPGLTKAVQEEAKAPKTTKTKNLPLVKEEKVLKLDPNQIADALNGSDKEGLRAPNGKKVRKWSNTSTNSDVLKDFIGIEDLDINKITYVPVSNKKTIDKANDVLSRMGYEEAIQHVKKTISEGTASLTDIAIAEELIVEARNRQDTQMVADLLMDVSILGTELGQKVQALSLIKKMTPEGQLKMYQKIITRAKAKGNKGFQDVEITPTMVNTILDAYDKNGNFNQDDLNQRVEVFKQQIAEQMKSTVGEQLDEWRYLSMLGNPKTHIRNIVSNIAMKYTLAVKNAVARTVESVLPEKLLPKAQRTKTWEQASGYIKGFAEQTAEEWKGVISGESKYSETQQLNKMKKTFKVEVLNKLSNLNSNLLEVEDWFFSKSAFKKSLQEYLTAQGIKTEQDIANNPETVEKAKMYALEQAQIATFRQYSWLANKINEIENKSTLGKIGIGAVMPFKKTPINVAKAGIKYSPLGFIKNLIYDIPQLKNGNINASQLIDNVSQSLTGTSLMLLGYALAQAGFITGGGDDDKESKFDYALGNQTYALKFGNNTYSISWLSPVAMPLLVGANAFKEFNEKEEWDMNVLVNSLASTLDPISEMSFVSGLTSALQSYQQGSIQMIQSIGESAVSSYVTQFFPTLFSQIASVFDDKKRSTRASGDSKFKYGEELFNQIRYKIPGLRNTLPVATDIWGNEQKQADSMVQRAFETFIAPYNRKSVSNTALDKEIKRLYSETGETAVIPGTPKGYIQYKDERYDMNNKEYVAYKKTYGTKANSYLNSLIATDAYKSATDDEKSKMVQEIYGYAGAYAKKDFFSNREVEYTSDEIKVINKFEELKMNSNDVGEFVAINKLSSTIKNNKDLDASEKRTKTGELMLNAKLKDNQLAYLYSKYYSSEEKLDTMLTMEIPMKQFIKFDVADIQGKYNSKTGKTINGSKKNATIEFVDKLNLSKAQKAILIKDAYNSYDRYNNDIIRYVNNLTGTANDKKVWLKSIGFDNYDKDVVRYIKSQGLSQEETEKKLDELGFTIRDGRVYY